MSDRSDAERYLKVGLHRLATAPEREVNTATWLLASIALNLNDIVQRNTRGEPREESERRQPWPFCRACQHSHDPATKCPEY